MVDFRHDVFAGRAAAVRFAVAHVEVDFCGYYYFVAVEAKFTNELAGDDFTAAELVDIGRVEKVYAEFDCFPEEGLCVFKLHCPREHAVFCSGFAEAHHAETYARDIYAAVAEFYILHC